jgi:hypothetical protein
MFICTRNVAAIRRKMWRRRLFPESGRERLDQGSRGKGDAVERVGRRAGETSRRRSIACRKAALESRGRRDSLRQVGDMLDAGCPNPCEGFTWVDRISMKNNKTDRAADSERCILITYNMPPHMRPAPSGCCPLWTFFRRRAMIRTGNAAVPASPFLKRGEPWEAHFKA